MELKEWLQYGWPSAALVAIGAFAYRKGWPFMVKTIERLLAALEQAQKDNKQIADNLAASLSNLADELKQRDAEFLRRMDIANMESHKRMDLLVALISRAKFDGDK